MTLSAYSATAKHYALVKNGVVEAFIQEEPEFDHTLVVDGSTKVEYQDSDRLKIGSTWDGSTWGNLNGTDLSAADHLAMLRKERNSKLTKCDWTQNGDVPSETQTKWQAYRQSLRDLPANTADPTIWNVTWPTEPT